MKQVLLIDDCPDARLGVRSLLDGKYKVLEAEGGDFGISCAAKERPDAILLDLYMPDRDGFEICRELKSRPETAGIPIIMLTGEFRPECRVRGLESGADDYVIRPFYGQELLARIAARLRTGKMKQEAKTLSHANLVLNFDLREAFVDGVPRQLTHLEFDLIAYFLKRNNRVLTRENILTDLWPDSCVEVRTVDTHIGRVRRKLMGWTGEIETVYRTGYILKSPELA